MDFFYTIVMWMVQVYKWIHFIFVKFHRKKSAAILTGKFRKSGINVILDYENPLKNTQENYLKYETSKSTQNEKVTMTIYDEQFFEKLASDRTLGLGLSYMDRLWDCNQLDELSDIFFRHDVRHFLYFTPEKFFHYLKFELFNLQSRKKAYEVAKEHYDLGEGLFESFLDPSMTYTCAYWRNAKNLEEAQQHKLDLIARKLKLEPGMRVLELGCGWGGLAHFLAKNYKVSVVACNIAKDGCKTAQQKCRGLPVEVRNCDYREVNEKFDRVVAVGLMEHVGPHNYKEFFQVAERCLKEHGLFLVHTIGADNDTDMRTDPFFSTYIFPNGSLPRATEITRHISGVFTMEDWQNFGHDYSKTLMVWYENFVRNWPKIKGNYENPMRFYRMWTFYLLISAGSFRSRKIHLWQIVLSKKGFPGGYESER